MPECLCFIFKCADDYLNSPACQNLVEPVEEFTYLNTVITPLYQYIRDQGYEILNGVYIRRERDHNKIIGYDDCNQLFWYPEGIERVVLQDKTKLVGVPPAERYLKLKDVHWKKCFFKTYKETRSWFHMLVNFNRIWIIHLTMWWFYTTYNTPTLLVPNYEQQVNQQPPGGGPVVHCWVWRRHSISHPSPGHPRRMGLCSSAMGWCSAPHEAPHLPVGYPRHKRRPGRLRLHACQVHR